MFSEDLSSLKYAELQKLAKNAGIRANQKIDKLIRALTEYYEFNKDRTTDDEAEQVTDVAASTNGELGESGNSSAISGGTPQVAGKTDSRTKKRKRTFELEEPTLKGDSTPTIENDQRVTRLQTSRNATPQSETLESQPLKRLRRDTCDKQSPLNGENNSHGGCSPSTRAIIDSIKGDCSSAERKEKLLSAIGKKVQQKMVSSPSKPPKNQPSQIPRFMAFLTNKKKEAQTSATPGSKTWNEVHQKEFARFDSIDVYLEKKQQRKENLSASTKKQLLVTKSPAIKSSSRPSKQSSKIQDDTKIFKPTVMSAKNINFDFSKPLTETGKTPKSKAVNTPSRKQAPTSSKLASTKKAPHTTPFKFTGNSNTLNRTVTLNKSVTSSKKNAFDIKASLAKPLTWKPHTGKLQPVEYNTKQNASVPRSVANVTSQSRMRNVLSRDSANKMRPVQAKNVRRAAQLDRRSNQKYVDMMKRRGLMA